MAAGARKDDAGIDLDRRRISVAAALALLGGATITIGGCGGGGGTSGPSAAPAPPATPPPATPPPATAELTGQVSEPEHRAVITAAELAAGGALTLDIRGTATHTHTVSLTADEVKAIARGEHVQEASTLEFQHYHIVKFNGVLPDGTVTGQACDPDHRAAITAAELAAGGDLSLDIRGGADHGHIVSLTAAEVATVRAGQHLQTRSTTNVLHSHEVTFN